MKYRVKVEYAFQGEFVVTARNREEASEKVLRDCGMSFGGVHTVLDDSEVDWDFDMTPEVRIQKVETIHITDK